MIRLTILYNLPPGDDEEAFLAWRLGEHQAQNAASTGVIRTDFGRVDEMWSFSDGLAKPPYRFMTIVDFVDRASMEEAFLSPEAQEQLRKDAKTIDGPLFLISEVLVATEP